MAVLAPGSSRLNERSTPPAGLAGAVGAIASALSGLAKAVMSIVASATGVGQARAGARAATGGGAAPVPVAMTQALEGALTPKPAAGTAPADTARPAASSKGAEAVEKAKKYLGKPYAWGATGPNSFDCSGLTQRAMKDAGIEIPRTSGEQFKKGTKVDKDKLEPGDLVFWNGDPPGHVGMYIGDGKVIHSPTEGESVKISPVDGPGKFSGARRYT